MEGVLFRPNVSGGIKFCAKNYEGKNYGSRMFSNNDHRVYYEKSYRVDSVRCGNKGNVMVLNKGDIVIVDDEKKNDKKMMKKEKIMIKKRSKLLKNLSRDISGLLLDPQKLQLKEASEVLLSQLKELQNEQKELKKKMKENKAKSKKGTCCSSSSSSSESSDSDCEREVLDMSRLKCKTAPVTLNQDDLQQKLALVIQEKESPISPISSPGVESYTLPKTEQDRTDNLLLFLEEKRVQENSATTINFDINNNNEKKIEVCMGGKCKKSGAQALLDEFQRVAAADVDVIGCKCMGKCRDGPNVRLVSTTSSAPLNGVYSDDLNGGLNGGFSDSSVLTRSKRTPRSSQPLCIGVGLEDVSYIVSKLVEDICC